MTGPSHLFVIDDPQLVPKSGYTSRALTHAGAAETLRGKDFFWCFVGEDGETRYHLWDLTRQSQVHFDDGVDTFLAERRVDRQRLAVGTGHTYLVLNSDQKHQLFTPMEK